VIFAQKIADPTFLFWATKHLYGTFRVFKPIIKKDLNTNEEKTGLNLPRDNLLLITGRYEPVDQYTGYARRRALQQHVARENDTLADWDTIE
jgi:hypothetical protein